jgi:hypothetical protein
LLFLPAYEIKYDISKAWQSKTKMKNKKMKIIV